MAKVTRFNPPPNWPTPPSGWTPPPGWAPDPSWGPPPPGWQLWVAGRANPRAGVYTFASVIGVVVVFSILGVTLIDSDDQARLIGRQLGLALIPGLVTYFLARSSGRHWWGWIYPVIVLVLFLFFSFLTLAGQLAGG